MGQGKGMFVCALLAMLDASRLVAQESTDAASPKETAAARLDEMQGMLVAFAGSGVAEKRIDAVFRGPLRTPLDFIETPLNQILVAISEEHEIPIQFDERAMEAIAVSPEVEVTAMIRNVRLRSALDLILANVDDLTYVIDNEVLLITTHEEAERKLEVRVYRVDDLVAPADGDALASDADFDTLIDIVVATLEAPSWAENGTGEGEISPFSPGMLVISQTHRVHELISQLFLTLRRTKAAVLADAPPDDAGKLVSRGMPISEDIAKTGSAQNIIRETLIRSVDWESESGDLGDQVSLTVLPSRVLVRHKPKVVRRVAQTVRDLALNTRAAMPLALGSSSGGLGGAGAAQGPDHADGGQSPGEGAGAGGSSRGD